MATAAELTARVEKINAAIEQAYESRSVRLETGREIVRQSLSDLRKELRETEAELAAVSNNRSRLRFDQGVFCRD